MNQKILTPAVLLLSLMAFTACPNNNRSNPQANQLQAPPPVSPTTPAPATNPTNPTLVDSPIKSFQCEFEGQRYKSHKYWNSSVSIPKTTALITINSGQRVYLRNKFLGFDIGKFGTLYMQYVPGKHNHSGADTLNLVDMGLNGGMNMTQSGFAGDEVRLSAMSPEGDMSVSISCKGMVSQFSSGTAPTSKTKLVCKGKSSTAVSGVEDINFERPLNSINAGESFAISEAVSAVMDAKATTITYTASVDPGYLPEVNSTASLKSPSQFTLKDKSAPEAEIDVLCKIQ